MPKRPRITSITDDLDIAEEIEIAEVVETAKVVGTDTEIELANTEIIEVAEEIEINDAELVGIEEKNVKKGLLDIQLEQKEFDADDLRRLFKNEHARFMESSKKVGHALLRETDEGTMALQFEPPARIVKDLDNKVDVQLRPLENIRLETAKYGAHSTQYLRAETPNGTEMVAKRSLGMQYTENGEITEGDFWRFSPIQSHMWHGKLFNGAGPEELPIFTDKLSDEQRKDLALEIKDISTLAKHHQWQIDHDTVLWREQRSMQPRKPNQNEVMGGRDHSAFKAVRDFGEEFSEELHPIRKEIIAKNNSAENLRKAKSHEKQHRHEWGHAMGYSLTHPNVNPQVPENLAAMPMYINTAMMISERTAKWFGLHRLDSEIKGDVLFTLIPSTDILDKGYEEFSFQEGDRKVVLHQDLNPWVKFPKFPKATDIGQTVMATYNLIVGNQPASVQSVQGVSKMPIQKPISSSSTTTTSSSNGMVNPTTKNLSTTSTTSSNNSSNKTSSSKRPVASTNTTTAHDSLPVGPLSSLGILEIRKLYKSLVSIETEFFNADYVQPWRGNTYGGSCGTGTIISYNNAIYVLTNAHVVADNKHVRVSFTDGSDKYKAKVINIGHQCDLALLQVDAPEFKKRAVPFKFGETLQIGDNIDVLGFPIGGDGVCFTTGPVSRIEVGIYEQSEEPNLIVQTQAPLNPGNSGGPVLKNSKLVALAFQGIELRDGINFIIPLPVIMHFLKDTFSPQGYKGFPTIQMNFQEINSEQLRKYFKLQPWQSGLRIKQIDKLSVAHEHLKVNDILTKIDGHSVDNRGLVLLPEFLDPISYEYLFLRKFIGDTVSLTVLRQNEQHELIEHTFTVTLKHLAGQTKKTGVEEHEKEPTFLIHSGVVFQPMTLNLIKNRPGKELITTHTPEDNNLMDIECKNPGELLLTVNSVLACDTTFGSEEVDTKLIRSVNGFKVKTMADLMRALCYPIDGQLVVILQNKTIVAVKHLSHAENMAMLKQHGIAKYCSIELEESFINGLEHSYYADSRHLLDLDSESSDSDSEATEEDNATLNEVNEEASMDLDAEHDQDENELEDDEEELREDGRGFIATEDEELADVDADLRLSNLKPLVVNGVHPGMAAFSSTVEGIQQRALREREALAAARRERGTTTTTTTTTAPVQFSRAIPEPTPKRRRLVVESDSDDEVSNKAPEPAHKVTYRR